MRFRIFYTTDPTRLADESHAETYPAGTVSEPYVERTRIEHAQWEDDAAKLAAWRAKGNEVDTDGTPISVERGVYHFVEIAEIATLDALRREYGELILGEDATGPTIEIYNDYRE